MNWYRITNSSLDINSSFVVKGSFGGKGKGITRASYQHFFEEKCNHSQVQVELTLARHYRIPKQRNVWINSHSKDHLNSSCWMLGTMPLSSRVVFIRDNRSVVTSFSWCEYSPITLGFNIFMFKIRRTLYHSSPCLHCWQKNVQTDI